MKDCAAAAAADRIGHDNLAGICDFEITVEFGVNQHVDRLRQRFVELNFQLDASGFLQVIVASASQIRSKVEGIQGVATRKIFALNRTALISKHTIGAQMQALVDTLVDATINPFRRGDVRRVGDVVICQWLCGHLTSCEFDNKMANIHMFKVEGVLLVASAYGVVVQKCDHHMSG